jgi:hypothetical protein
MNERLVEIVNNTNAECWKCIDKYSIAGFTRLAANLAEIKGDQVSMVTNESGALALGEDYRKLLISAIEQYQRFYTKIVSQLPDLQKMPFLKDKASNEEFSLDAFKWLAEQNYADGEAKQAFESYYELAKTINDIHLANTTGKTNKQFAEAIDSFKKSLEGKTVEVIKDAKIESEIKNVPDGVEVVETEKEPEEDQVQVPPETEQKAEKKGTEIIKGLIKLTKTGDVKDWEALNNLSQKYRNTVYQLMKDNGKQELKDLVNKNKGILPRMWKSMELLNINDDVMESIVLELHSGMILAEQMISLLEEEEPKPDTQEPKNDSQTDTQGDSQTDTQGDTQDDTQDDTQEQPEEEEDTSTLGKLETLRKQVGEMLKAHDDAKFVGAYNTWLKNVQAIIGTIKDEKRKKDLLGRDPFYALCQMLVAAERAKAKAGEQEKPEENKEQNAAEQEEKQVEQEAQEVADNFLNMLREKYK